MHISDSDLSCGTAIVSSMSGLKDNVNKAIKQLLQSIDSYDAADELGKWHFSQLIFSDNEKYGNGEALAAWIRKHKIGTLVQSRLVINRNHPQKTHGKIRTWIWTLPGNARTKLRKACGWTRDDNEYYRTWW